MSFLALVSIACPFPVHHLVNLLLHYHLDIAHSATTTKPLTKPHNVLSIGHVCIIDGSLLPCHNLLVYHCHYPLLLSLTEQSFHYYGRNHCPNRRLLLTKLMPAALALNCNFVSFCCTTFMHVLSLMHYSCTTIT